MKSYFQFIDTYQEFVPSSKIAKGSKKSPKRSPDRDPKPKKNEKATRKEAYVPPPLRAKTAKEEKPLTTDQIDRIRVSYRLLQEELVYSGHFVY